MNSKKRFIFVQDDKRHAEIMKKDLQRTDSDLYHLYCAMEGDSAEAAAVRKLNTNGLVSEMNNAWANYEVNKARWEATRGVKAMNANRTQSAKEYWKPYQDKYHRLRSEGMSIGKARYEILKQIRDNGSWKKRKSKPEPSQNTLDTWLKD